MNMFGKRSGEMHMVNFVRSLTRSRNTLSPISLTSALLYVTLNTCFEFCFVGEPNGSFFACACCSFVLYNSSSSTSRGNAKRERVIGRIPDKKSESTKWLFGCQVQNARKFGMSLPKPLRNLPQLANKSDIEYDETVQTFSDLIDTNGTIRRCLTLSIEEQVEEAENEGQEPMLRDIPDLLAKLNVILTMSPYYSETEHSDFPMSAIFNPLLFTTYGYPLFTYSEFNNGIRPIMQKWCQFLDSSDSRYVLTDDADVGGWFQPAPYSQLELDIFVMDKSLPYWGFSSYNSFFHREIQLEHRPLPENDSNDIIVSSNDGHVYNIQENVQAIDQFWLKGQPYSLINMLNNNTKYIEKFTGGTVIQTFLSGADYHRLRSPITGTVVDKEIVSDLMFVQLPFTKGQDWGPGGDPSQSLEACQNTRGLLYIEADDPRIGTVCVIPVGITEISSVTFDHSVGDPIQINDKVNKGDGIGYFSFGGSSCVLLFQKDVVDVNSLPPVDSQVHVREQIATLKN